MYGKQERYAQKKQGARCWSGSRDLIGKRLRGAGKDGYGCGVKTQEKICKKSGKDSVKKTKEGKAQTGNTNLRSGR